MSGVIEWHCGIPGCDEPTHERRICADHVTKLVRWLAELPARMRELDITLSRQSRMTVNPTSNRHAVQRPLPYDPRASEARTEAFAILYRLMRTLLADAETPPTLRTVEVAQWLRAHTANLLGWDRAISAYLDIHRVVLIVDRVTDRPPVVLYAGRCGWQGCDIALYAQPGQLLVECPVCRTRHDVTRRRTLMRSHIDGMLLTLPEIVRFAGYFEGFDRKRAWRLLDAWRRRGRITPRVVKGRDVYPFGATLGMLLAAERRPTRPHRLKV